MDITRWPALKSDWLYRLQPKMENSIQSAKTSPGADYGSDHELLITKFRIKLKKVGETTRPFRYDLNKIPYSFALKSIVVQVCQLKIDTFQHGNPLQYSCLENIMDRGAWWATGHGVTKSQA